MCRCDIQPWCSIKQLLGVCFWYCTEPISVLGKHQRMMYNGHKRVHAVKLQTVVAPKGLIANLFWQVGKLLFHYLVSFCLFSCRLVSCRLVLSFLVLFCFYWFWFVFLDLKIYLHKSLDIHGTSANRVTSFSLHVTNFFNWAGLWRYIMEIEGKTIYI